MVEQRTYCQDLKQFMLELVSNALLLCCRYPTFVDALRDLDDPLTLVHLFATLPADSFHKIPAKVSSQRY